MKKKIVVMLAALTAVMNIAACGASKENGEKHVAAATVTEKNVDSFRRAIDKKDSAETKRIADKESKGTKVKAEEKSKDTRTMTEQETPLFTERLDQVDVVSLEGKHILLNVPEGYFWGTESGENEGGCFFQRADDKETVFVNFYERLLEVNAEYCDSDLWVPYYATGEESEVMTEEVDGRTVYYKHITYEYDEYNGHVCYETVKAMCEVGDHMLVVETDGLSGEKADFDEIREFFEMEEK